MNFLISFVNTFLVDYFFIFIINLLPVRSKLKWQVGVISLTNLPGILYDLYIIIGNIGIYGSNILIAIGMLLSKVLAYIAIMVWLLKGRRIFKTRRQREFEREVKGKSTSIVPSIILFTLSLITLGFIIYITLYYTSDLLWTMIGSIVAFIALVGFGLYLFPFHKVKNIKVITKKPTKLLFNLKIKDSSITFISDFKEDLSYYLGTLADDFVLSNYGTIEQGKEIYCVKGVHVDYIDKSTVKGINMSICKDTSLCGVIGHFNQYQHKYIKIDDKYNIIEEKNVD